MTPVFYSFRRCPYAMRARLGLAISGVQVEHREVLLRDKPAAMLKASPKATVPVLVTDQGVIDESFDIMVWALSKNDPEMWLDVPDSTHQLISDTETRFKPQLDRYKYANRYGDTDPNVARQRASDFLIELDRTLSQQAFLTGPNRRLPDMAILPFIRQFAHVDLDWFENQPWPHLVNWLAAFKTSALFQSIMGKHDPWKPPQ